jgi:hypothetical protein
MVHVANKFVYMDNLGGCHVEVLDDINSKFNRKLEEKINSKFNKNDEFMLISIT